MNESQEQLYQDLRKWADSKGNWLFVRHLDWYYEYWKLRELPVEIINQKPVKPVHREEVKQLTGVMK